MKLDKHISELLYDHECVIVPEMGGFLTRYHPAEVNAHQHTVSPPSKRVSFNVYLTQNDGLLANKIAGHQNVMYAEALQLINSYVRSYKAELSAGNKFVIENVGTLFKDANNTIQFEPSRTNYLKDSFGLELVHYFPVEQKASSKQLPKQLRPSLTPEDAKARRKVRINAVLLTASLLWLTLNVFFIFPNDFNFASLNLFSKDTLMPSSYKKTQEPTVVVPRENIQADTNVLYPPSEGIGGGSVKESPPPTPASGGQIQATPADPLSNQNNFFLIVGAFRTHQNAEKLREELKSKGYTEADILDSTRNNFNLVYIKGFNTFNEASAGMNQLHEQGRDAWIYRR